jgi:hypothetical protein
MCDSNKSAPPAAFPAGGGCPAGSAGACPATSNGPFDSPDAAARAALNACNAQSIRDNREYSGMIYQGADGKYYFTGPVQGGDQGANPFRDAPSPAGTTDVAAYHTHGPYGTADPATGAVIPTNDPARDDFNADNFSAQDKRSFDGKGYPGYLGTPSGTF